MRDCLQFYINGDWADPITQATLDVINPATESVVGRIPAGTAADVDLAVAAARTAFASYSVVSRDDRLDLLGRVLDEYDKRYDDIAQAIMLEMGAPAGLARNLQTMVGKYHIVTGIEVLKRFEFEQDRGANRVVKEPIGVCGLITPWNWPINQILCKVVPALATGCTMVLKPSEEAPFSAHILAEVLHDAGVPPGVFNMVHGTGLEVGSAISGHPDVDMVSFTGSTRAGIEVATAAAPGVKRVAQELGGKSPNIILEDADFESAVAAGIGQVMMNSGQSCNSPTRMLVPRQRMEEVISIARRVAEKTTVGDPANDPAMGPVVNKAQWNKIQRLIRSGIDQGATLVAGGLGLPDALDKGYYVKPTVFANVSREMTIAREEIFGPVASILGYDDIDEAVRIGNDTEYGLAAYIWGSDPQVLRNVAERLRAGQVSINGSSDMTAPFGGYKMSGNGREWGDYAFHEYLETKAILGFAQTASLDA